MDVSAGDQIEIVARLLLAALLGAVIGLERDLRSFPAGLRTMALVAMGAALFTEVSLVTGAGDRIAAQVVTGIGFLGAGIIFRQGGDVKGVTTAAMVWAVAAIGIAVGRELYIVAVVATAIVLVALELRTFTKGTQGFEGRIREWLERVAPVLEEDSREQRGRRSEAPREPGQGPRSSQDD